MTTYTLTGIAVYYDASTDDTAGVDNTDVTLELVVPDSTTSLSYTVNPAQPGDEPGDETVDIALDDYTVRINGMTIGADTGLDLQVSIFEVTWVDISGSHTSTVLVPFFDQSINVPGLGAVLPDYIFVIDGDPLPVINTPAEWDALDASIIGIGIPTGTYGPNTAIPLTSLGATVSEDDLITGTSDKDVLRGGAGDDEIYGLDGNDRLFGGNGDDALFGGNGNDTLNPGDNTGFDTINTGAGKDKVLLTGVSTGYVSLQHWDLTARITVDIDGNANTGTIKKAGASITTITDVQNPMLADGLGLSGTSFNDIFNITVVDDGWMQISGGMGKDTFNITDSTGRLRLDYRHFDGAVGGVTVNLGTGKVKDDGFGTVDTITGTGKVWEIRSTMQDDRVIGSANDESFILMAGNDFVNGGDGFDRLRYDRTGVDGVTVDLDAGTATGMWSGEAFTHTIKNIEHVVGSNGDDILVGADGIDVRLEGRDGDDRLEGAFGDDTLQGGNGKDKLWGDKGKDLLQGGDGNDRLWGEGGKDRLEGGDGNDKMLGGGGNDRMLGGKGKDQMDGGDGNDTMTGGGGFDTFIFSAGNDTITDFNTTNDKEKIDLSDVGSITDFADLTGGGHLTTDLDGNLVIDDLAGNTLTLTGLTIVDLAAGDFIF